MGVDEFDRFFTRGQEVAAIARPAARGGGDGGQKSEIRGQRSAGGRGGLRFRADR